MSPCFHRSPLFWSGASAIALVGVISTHASGVQSGVSSVPANSSRALSSCSQCHVGSQPTATRTNGPTTTLTASALVLNANQQITVSTSATGGVTGTTGGFLCEATRGTFAAGTNSHTNNATSITQSNNTARSWTFPFTAPATAGLVELTSVVNTTNGSGTSGDRFAFSGFDSNATVGTPVRLFVLPAGVTTIGTACADGYGNRAVLGAPSSPTIGNAAFGFQLHGGSPGALTFLLAGFNPPGFTGIDLGAALGITGCTAYVANPAATATAFATAGVAQRAEGTCSFALPLPNDPRFLGTTLDVQGAYMDPSVPTRALPLTFTNGLHVIVQ